MSTWLILVSDEFRQNFERAVEAAVWDMVIKTRTPPMTVGDRLYFWVTAGGGLVGRAVAASSPRDISTSDRRSWVDSDDTQYRYRIELRDITRIDHPGFPAGDLMEQIGTGRLVPATFVPASAEAWLRAAISGYEYRESDSDSKDLAEEWRVTPTGEASASELEEDLRRHIEASIVMRQGQGQFRADLLYNYEGRCAVSGTDVVAVLDAAHIMPYMGSQTDVLENGILLRTDLHTLFDKHLLTIESGKVRLSPQLAGTDYAQFDGASVRKPDRGDGPSEAYLRRHNEACASWLSDAV